MRPTGAGSKSVCEKACSVCQIACSVCQIVAKRGGRYVKFPVGCAECRPREGAGMFTCSLTGLRPAHRNTLRATAPIPKGKSGPCGPPGICYFLVAPVVLKSVDTQRVTMLCTPKMYTFPLYFGLSCHNSRLCMFAHLHGDRMCRVACCASWCHLRSM